MNMLDIASIEAIKKQGLNAFLDFASIGIILVDKHGEILIANKFASKLFEYEEGDLLGKNLNILIPHRFKESHVYHHKSYYEDPQSRPMGMGMDLFAIKKGGTEFPVEVSLGTYRNESNEVYVIAFINDITLRKENEQSIKKLNSELEKKVNERTEALADAIVNLQKQIKQTEDAKKELAVALAKEKDLNELKSRFVSMASHEFRTPLSTILSSTYLLQQYVTSDDQPKREKHLDRILSAVSSLDDILEDLLSVGKIEEGKVVTKMEKIDLNELIESIIHQFNPTLKKGQRILFNLTGDPILNSDKTIIRHVINNLISNASKFSAQDKTISVSVDTTAPDKWSLKVKDEGIGIPMEDQKNLFERFYRATNVASIKGTGLGLHIVARYVDLLKGVISVESAENQGTEFKLLFNK